MRPPRGHVLLPLVACLALSACIIRVRQVEVEPVPSTDGVRVTSPVKAHLLDGTTVVFTEGVTVRGDTLLGAGLQYDLRLQPAGTVARLPLSDVAGMENFRTGINVPVSVALSVPATALGYVGTVVVLKAIFGSCPTFYSDGDDGWTLESEGFSYSIAPLFESRDVDRLSVLPDAAGRLELEVRNEALETHYINHLELLEVRHAADETVMPDSRNAPLALRGVVPASRAVDRAGRDVLARLAAADGVAFETDPAHLASAREDDMQDHIDLVFPAQPGADSAAVVLRLRNSLLTTVLLYDVMLADAGARSLDWLGRDMEQVGSVLEMAQWYNRHMGLRVEVWDGERFRQVARIADTGPIAWKDIAAVVPVLTEDSLRVRLSFVTDGWRIDRVALATGVRRPGISIHAARRITNAEGREEAEALRSVAEPDEQYLQTTPGQRFTLLFEPGAAPAGESRTLLLASQGYYTEWIRPDWIRSSESQPFRATDAALLSAVERWRTRQASFEAEFYDTRIPVR
jgi:hypothetical protein